MCVGAVGWPVTPGAKEVGDCGGEQVHALDAVAPGERLDVRDEQAAMTLPLAAGQNDQRAQQPVGTVALQPAEADRPLVVGQFEERPAGQVEIVRREPRRLERGTEHRVLTRRQRLEADAAHAVSIGGGVKIVSATKCAASAPTSCAAMNPGTDAGAMPAKLSLSDRATVIAGFAELVDEVNQ